MENGPFEDVFPIESGDTPGSYVSLPEGIYLELREGQNFCPDGKGQKFVSFQNKNVIARNKCRFMLLPSHAPTVSFCSISI